MSLSFTAISQNAISDVSGAASLSPVLVGVAATGAVAPFSVTSGALSFALVGVAATGAVAAFAASGTDADITLTGVAATGVVADFALGPSQALVGVAATGAVAAFSAPSIAPTLTGVAAIGAVGAFFGQSPTFTLVGVAATGAVADFTVPVVANYVLNVNTGYYALNGEAAYFSLHQSALPAFEFDEAYAWSDFPASAGLQFIAYNPFVLQMFVQYTGGFAVLYNGITQSAAQNISIQIYNGTPTAQALSGFTPS